MEYPIIESSPIAKAKIKAGATDEVGTFFNSNFLTKYPFDMLEIGQSFTVPLQENKEFKSGFESQL